MPFVTVRIWEGRSDEQKALIQAKVTAAVVESMQVRAEAVTVLLEETPKVNWGIGGKPPLKCSRTNRAGSHGSVDRYNHHVTAISGYHRGLCAWMAERESSAWNRS